MAGNEGAGQVLRLDRLDILAGGQTHDRAVLMGSGHFIACIGRPRAPEVVEVLPAPGGKLRAHLEAIRLNQVEGAKYAIEARKNVEMLLGISEVILGQRVRLEPHIGVTAEHEYGLLGIARGEGRGVRLVAGMIQFGEGVREIHEGLESALPQTFDHVHELLTVVQQLGYREVAYRRFLLGVQLFRGGYQSQHVASVLLGL